MFSFTVARNASRAIKQATPATRRLAVPLLSVSISRPLSSTAVRTNKNNNRNQNDKGDPLLDETTKSAEGAVSSTRGEFARTDDNVSIGYPDERGIPLTQIVRGRGGMHFKRTLPQFSLENKVSVVTGGARGLGLVMAQALVTSGSNVAIVDLNKEDAELQAKELLKHFKSENPGLEDLSLITAHYADIANQDSVNAALSEIVEKHGRIDNLINSAGFTENFDAVKYPLDRMRKLWGVNVDGAYLFATGVAKHLINRRASGSIVLIGSMSGTIVNVPQPQAPYNASKAAVRQLAASFAVEWSKYDIRVNCISPGYMLTPLTRKILDENPELKEKWVSLIPSGKMGTPDDLTGAVTFLLSDASKYITGIELRVDGGYTLT